MGLTKCKRLQAKLERKEREKQQKLEKRLRAEKGITHMSKADDDAAKWMEMNRKAQYREWIKATEAGDAHYINEHGDVIKEKEEKTTPNK